MWTTPGLNPLSSFTQPHHNPSTTPSQALVALFEPPLSGDSIVYARFFCNTFLFTLSIYPLHYNPFRMFCRLGQTERVNGRSAAVHMVQRHMSTFASPSRHKQGKRLCFARRLGCLQNSSSLILCMTPRSRTVSEHEPLAQRRTFQRASSLAVSPLHRPTTTHTRFIPLFRLSTLLALHKPRDHVPQLRAPSLPCPGGINNDSRLCILPRPPSPTSSHAQSYLTCYRTRSHERNSSVEARILGESDVLRGWTGSLRRLFQGQ